jgi:hypothetical protein
VDPLEGPALKIARARKQIDEATAEWQAFSKTGPYRIVLEHDPDDNTRDWMIAERCKEPPAILSVIIGEAVYSLRTTLDQIVSAVAVRSGAVNVSDVAFPFAGSFDQFVADSDQKMRKLPTDAVELIRRLQPYRGGDDLLWAINRLNNIDKHRNLINVSAAGANFATNVRMKPVSPGRHVFTQPSGFHDAMADRVRLLGFPRGGMPDGAVEINMSLVFDEVFDPAGIPWDAIGSLTAAVALVESIREVFQLRFFPNYR